MPTEDELYQRIITRKPALAKFDRQEVLNRIYARKPELKAMVSKSVPPPPSTDFAVSTGATGTISGITPSVIAPIAKEPDIKGMALKAAGALPGGGALAGSVAGALLPMPLRAGLAGLGGAGGEAGRQLAVRALGGQVPATPQEAAQKIGIAGGVAAGSEAVGSTVLKYGAKAAEKILPPISNFIAKRLPERLINSIIKPRLRDFIYGKNPGAGVVEEGIVATSFDDLAKKIAVKKDEIGKMFDPLIKKYGAKKIDLSKVIKPLDDAIEAASKYKNVNAAAIARLNDTRHDIIQNIITKDATGKWGVPLADAVALKREIGEITRFTGNDADDKIVNASLKRIYRYIDDKLDIAVPAMKRLNERWANMMGADKAIKYRAQLLERQNVLHLPEMVTGGAVGVGTGMAGAGVGAAIAHKALGSTLVKTATAKALSKSPLLSKPIKAAAKMGIPTAQFLALYGITPNAEPVKK